MRAVDLLDASKDSADNARGAVVLTLIPTLIHYFQSVRKAKKKAAAGITTEKPAPTPEV